jgi:Zn-dependent M28 family amino/carboxypeptidase
MSPVVSSPTGKMVLPFSHLANQAVPTICIRTFSPDFRNVTQSFYLLYVIKTALYNHTAILQEIRYRKISLLIKHLSLLGVKRLGSEADALIPI